MVGINWGCVPAPHRACVFSPHIGGGNSPGVFGGLYVWFSGTVLVLGVVVFT